MLYKLSSSIDRLEPLRFIDFAQANALEKDLENLLAEHLLETLYEGDPLLPFFQERRRQEEADIYALDRDANLVIFELKRAGAGRGALEQLLRYVEVASSWDYLALNRRFSEYRRKQRGEVVALREAHRQAFGFAEQLDEDVFNRKQRMCVVANSAEDGLIRAVSYWRDRGLDVDFLPYRVYEINGDRYFEFFSKPFDSHLNPAFAKGVLFDTNASYDVAGEEPWFQRMITRRRVSAYGGIKGVVDYLRRGDTVFYHQKLFGIIAAARITGAVPHEFELDEERYWDVQFLTAIPTAFTPPYTALSVSEIRETLGFNFFWARTLKVPYLDAKQTERLLHAVIQKVGPPPS
jgi:hypothetical protein